MADREQKILRDAERLAGKHYSKAAFRADWEGYWPVVDGGGLLTGDVVDSDTTGWLNVEDLAAIYEDDAKAAGWTIEEGRAYPPEAK